MPQLISTGVYAYADTDRNTSYVLGAQLTYMGSWLPAGSYTPNQVVEYNATNHICIRSNTAQNPENGLYWSHLSRVDPANLTPQQQLDLEIAAIGSLANQALTVSFAATNAANAALSFVQAGSTANLIYLGTTALDAAWAGTALANEALQVAYVGTNLAQAAFEIAVDGTNGAYDALVVAWQGTNLAQSAFDIAVNGTDLAQDAYNLAAIGTNTGTAAYNLAAIGTNVGTAAYDLATVAQDRADAAFEIAVDGTDQAQTATTTANSAFEIAVDGTNAAYAALTTAWVGTNLAQSAFDVAVDGTDQANTATTTANTALFTAWTGTDLGYTALTTAWTGTAAADEKVNRSGDTMTGSLSVPSLYFTGSEAYLSAGTIAFDFAGSTVRQVNVSGTTHVTTLNQDIGWNGTNVPSVTGYFLHDTVEWPLSFDDRIRFVGGSAPPATLPANEISVLTLSVMGTVSQTIVVGAYAPEVV